MSSDNLCEFYTIMTNFVKGFEHKVVSIFSESVLKQKLRLQQKSTQETQPLIHGP